MRSLLLLAALSCAATAQTFDGINAPASRTVTLAADEATFTIAVAAGLDSTQQQVKQALQNAGLPNPTVVATGLGQVASQWFATPVQMLYSATATIAAGSAIDTAKNLEGLRTSPPDPLQSLQYSVTFNPSQAKIDAMRQTVMPQLVDDSRRLAQSLASAAGVKLGVIRSISDSPGAGRAVYAYVSTGAQRSGDFSQILRVFDPATGVPFPGTPSSSQVTFSINVVFAVTP
jgi:hypothetical protein